MIYFVQAVCKYYSWAAELPMNDWKQRDGKSSRASTGRSCLQSPLSSAAYLAAAIWSKQGSIGSKFLKDPQDQRPHYAHIWAHPLQVLVKVGAGR